MITPSSPAYTTLNNLLGRCPVYRATITKGPPNIQPAFTYHWSLDEASGTRFASYPSPGRDFTSNGSVGSIAGKHGLCATFNGTTQYLSQVGTPWGIGDTWFFVRAWIYLEGKAGDMAIVGQYKASDTALQSWLLAYDSGLDRLTFNVWNNPTASAFVAAESLGSPALNTWYELRAWRHPGLSGMLYIQVNTETTIGDVDSTDGGAAFPKIVLTEDLRIGAAGGIGSPPVVGDFWKGRIDEVTISVGYIPTVVEQSIIASGSLPVPADLYTTYTFDTAHDVTGAPSDAISALHLVTLERQLEMAYSRFPLSTLTFFLKTLPMDVANFVASSAGASCVLQAAFWELPGEYATMFTGYITNIRAEKGVFTVTAQSTMSLALNSLVFAGAQTQLANSLNAFLTEFPVKDESPFEPSGEWIAIDNELIPYTAIKPGLIVTNTRMNDVPFKVLPPLIPDGQAISHELGATVRELVGLGRMTNANAADGGANDMHPLDHMQTIITGILPNGSLATNKQSIGFSNRLQVNAAELAALRPIIGNNVQFLFLDDEGISAKDFLEKEIFGPCAIYPTENAAGQIGAKAYPREADFVAVDTLDDSHILDVPQWDRSAEVHINQVIFYYDWMPTNRQFLTQTTFTDDGLVAQHGRELPLVLYSKGIRSPYDEADLTVGTRQWFQETPRFLFESAVRHLSRFGSRSAVLRCDTILRDNLLLVSDDVTGIFTNVPDEINGDDNINRPFKVTHQLIDFVGNTVAFDLLEHSDFVANVHKVPFGTFVTVTPPVTPGYALIDHSIGGASAADPTTATSSVVDSSLGDLMIAFVAYYDLSTRGTVDDNKGNAWNALAESAIGSSVVGRFFWSRLTNVGSGHTARYHSVDNSYGTICIAVFSGSPTSPFDVQNGATGAAVTSLATGSVTPFASLELIVTGVGLNGDSATLAVDSGFSITDKNSFVGGDHFGAALAYKIKSDALAENATWSLGGPQDLAARIAAFLPA